MSFHHPHTPQSPSQVSPATTSSDAQTLLSSSMTTASTLPTPAHSVSGSGSLNDSAMADESHNKRKRTLEDEGSGDRGQKKVQLEGPRLGIQDLHLDVGAKYLLCQTHDLYDMFDLSGLAAEVAREKPNGEKNALRKTYKGHMKRLGVAGHFDVVKKPEGTMSEFMSLVNYPDLEWDVQEVKGKDISDGLSQSTLSLLDKAMTMSKGPIPKGVWDTSVLGDLAPSPDATKRPTATPGTPAATPSAAAAAAAKPKSTSLPLGHDPSRPRRSIKKRAYGDSSSEGYGEGYPDDDGEGGYSTGEGEGGQKRRRQASVSQSPAAGPSSSNQSQAPGNNTAYPNAVRQQNYGPGMVGA
ncbi:Rox3 mediator complex subunit [Geosmithia morbida]|uniref:Mediator of RNA polymerase II transcription subunit 19 n=1 Tax=Geosmithia morbida TaxID=1094350 RepID=A0A9P4YP09_9HYPO|nr:Rox3 mediator complex subunit [Geosmithia morbida]KAF4120488.1 Rox3 mediator complex subunit [Geosmithia morbida]